MATERVNEIEKAFEDFGNALMELTGVEHANQLESIRALAKVDDKLRALRSAYHRDLVVGNDTWAHGPREPCSQCWRLGGCCESCYNERPEADDVNANG
jgi:hypothetical protein